ncbi:DUF4232 domain-containing protein [Streptomyces sparsogenes]|uniref:DUF4232 domain-containing protein n=1 Tax=Streptomyces sparsogenes TaxID=67365 RepID=UPI00332C67DB
MAGVIAASEPSWTALLTGLRSWQFGKTAGDSPTAVGSPSSTVSDAVPGPVGSDTSGPSSAPAPTSSAGASTASSTRVHGFPGVAFVDGTGKAVTPGPERATDERQQTVTLAPGARAWSVMVYTNPAITHVTTVTPAALLITPPDETAPISVPWTGGEVSNTAKASMPRVSPLRPGDGA